MRKLLLVAAWLVATTAGCTSLLGDFSVSGDAGSVGSNEGGVEAGPVTCNVTTPNETDAGSSTVSVYVGQAASLSASSTSSGAQYSWNLMGQPGSSTAMVQNGSTSSASLTPDVPGSYPIILSVSSSGVCVQATTLVTVQAYLPSVIFAQGNTAAPGGSSASYVVSSQDGGAPTPIMCAVTNAHVDTMTTPPDDVAHYAAYAGRAYDFWEAPAGTPSKYAAFTIDYASGSGYFSHLWAGTTSSNCTTSPPKDLTTSDFGPGLPQGGPNSFFGSEPSFSPDGSHFVVYDDNLNIIVYASDGSAHNMVAPYSVQGGSTYDPSGRGTTYIYPPRVAWQSSSMAVDWARSTSTGFEIVTVPITSGTPTQVMNCAGVTPREIAVLDDGSIIASLRATTGGAENLYHLTTAGCTQTAYTNLTGATDIATDFSVSPDFKTIAFLEQTSGMQCPGQTTSEEFCPGGNVFIVPVGNSSQPVQIGSDVALYGPRWIGGGTRLVYTRLDSGGTTTPATSIITVSPSSMNPNSQKIGGGDGTMTFASTGGSAACSLGGRASAGAAGLVLLAGLGLVGRRRRAAR